MKLVTSAFLLLASTTSFAESGWFWQNPLPTGINFGKIVHLDASVAVVVGSHGTILRTTDGGATWSRQVSGTTQNLSGASFPNAKTGTAVCTHRAKTGTTVGVSGTILRTTTGGE